MKQLLAVFLLFVPVLAGAQSTTTDEIIIDSLSGSVSDAGYLSVGWGVEGYPQSVVVSDIHSESEVVLVASSSAPITILSFLDVKEGVGSWSDTVCRTSSGDVSLNPFVTWGWVYMWIYGQDMSFVCRGSVVLYPEQGLLQQTSIQYVVGDSVKDRSLEFGVAIIIALMSLGFAGFVFNRIKRKAPWLR